MKKRISIMIAFVAFAILAIQTMTAQAVSGSASLSGLGTVRAGDTITITYKVSGSGLFGASGTLSYDGGQVQLLSTKQGIGGSWAVEFNGANFVAYDNNLASPINGGATLFTATFKVGSVAPGTSIRISCNGTVSDGSADANVSATYSANVAAPLSTNNRLSSLTVSNADITPAFSPDRTQYSADVGFEVSKLQINATAEDATAKVSVHSPALTANGTTNVSVTVTAENGAKKVYTITVHRAQDPNYVPSGNNNLSGITVEGFLLSPVFTPENTKYVVWLPYETEGVNISGTASDGKASVETVGGSGLLAGQDNEVKVICTAENGEKKEYIVVVKRAPAHDGSVDEKVEEVEVEDTSKEEEVKESKQKGVAIGWLFVIGLLALVVGIVIGFMGNDKIRMFVQRIKR